MVEVTGPRLGEMALDPACGTGGFLAESYLHLEISAKRWRIGRYSRRGASSEGEAKPLPYMLCQMNLLLHGMESPQIDPENSLRFNIREIGEKDRWT